MLGVRAVRVPSEAQCFYKGYFSYFKQRGPHIATRK